MRVAVTQFATNLNAEENLATCVRIINEAAVSEPSLIVLPELCNTLFFNAPLYASQLSILQSGYVDHNQAWEQALSIDGFFLQHIAEQAKKHNCYIVLNVTLRQDASREHQNDAIRSNISITSCLFSPTGNLIHQADKQVLIGHESDFFMCADNVLKVVKTPFGKLGFLTGDDALTFEVSRELGLNGAQLLCHSMNSFAFDQSALHNPARACENKIFLASANKVGLLVPEENLSQQHTSQEYFIGAGQSQIVSPNGKVLAKMDNNEEGYVFADLEFVEANNKCRPDGTDVITQRRPELYKSLAKHIPQPTKYIAPHKNDNDAGDSHIDDNRIDIQNGSEDKVPATANVAIFATYKSNEQAIDDVCHYIVNNLSDIIQLPELFFIADKTILNDVQTRAEIEYLSKQLINQIGAELRPFQYVCTSLIIEGIHQAVIISEQGLFATQQQLHFCERYQWTALGNGVNIIELPLEQGNINVAMLTADDANIPESVKVAALKNVHVLLVPFDIQEPCEVEYSLMSRAAEHRICIVAASREKNFAIEPVSDNSNKNLFSKNKVKSHKSTGFIANLTIDAALQSTELTQWKSRKFNGYINQPLVKQQHGKITKAVIHPIATCNKGF